MKSPPLIILLLSRILLYFENNGQSSQYKTTNKQNECNCVCRKNVIHFQKTGGSNYCKPWPWLFICKFF